jgi:hypothetical protein
MDAAALSVIRTAAPFAFLPEGYAATTLDLQFSFYYNSELPREPAQQPKVVPVGTAANRVLSAKLRSTEPGRRGSEAVALRHPVMPVANSLGSGLVGINGNQL